MSRKTSQHGRIESMTLPVPNEARLLELHNLAKRQQETVPGPGSYEVVSATGLRPCSTSQRRRHQPQLDGPVYLQPGESSLRSKQMDNGLLLRDSGVSPNAYDGLLKKDACLTRAPTPKIGTASRACASPMSSGQTCLSISRSLNSGLNWMKPLPLQQLQQQLANGSSSGAAAVRSRMSSSSACGSKVMQAVGRSRSPSPACMKQRQQQQQTIVAMASADRAPLQWQDQQQQQSAACSVGAKDSSDGQQKEQQHCPEQRQPGQDALSQGRSHTPGGAHIPWQLAKSIAEWDEVVEALNQHQSHQLPQRQQAQQREQARTKHSSVIVLEEQQVLQHMSAARAAGAVAQLAARRQRWQELNLSGS